MAETTADTGIEKQADRSPTDDRVMQRPHDLEDHLRSAALLAGRFAEAWGASETAALAALWHDLGKYAPEFQAMIRSTDAEAHLEGVVTGRDSGSITPARRALGDGAVPEQPVRPVARLPYRGHHSGLPDWSGEGGRTGLKDRLATDLT